MSTAVILRILILGIAIANKLTLTVIMSPDK